MDPEINAAKGVKLPYFHRTLSPEDQALIGDITPKPLTSSLSNSAENSSKLTVGSAWNSANTWEERDCTSWAKDKLTEVFSEKFHLPKTNIYTVKLGPGDSVSGNAQVTHIRGKARFIYEFSLTLKFSVTTEAGAKYSGKIAVSDIINDQLDDIEFTLTWTTGKAPPNIELAAVRSSVLGGKLLKSAVASKVKDFEEAFRNI